MKLRAIPIFLVIVLSFSFFRIPSMSHAQEDDEVCIEILEDYLIDVLEFDDLDELFDYLDSLEEDEIDQLLEETGGFELMDACENGELDDFEPPEESGNDEPDNNTASDELDVPEFTGVLEIQDNPNADHPAYGVFSKYVNVFGVSIYATEDVPDIKILHVAHIMAEYLDNDEDGMPDNALVMTELAEQQAAMVMFNDEGSQSEASFVDNLHGNFGSTQLLYGFETHAPDYAGQDFDATYEEVWHLITHVGYSAVYPEIFGEEAGSEIANAMDIARGGFFEDIPATYPAGAWYTYDDRTCEYDCQVTEYFYWGLTTLLGAQDYPGRASQIGNEWRFTTAAEFEAGDPALYELLTNPDYILPNRLPDGEYAPNLTK